MSDEELERLAAEMRNIRPSDKARKRGMAAAMEAFEAEFAAESEKISTPVQGSTREARPTVQIQWSSLMSKINEFFSLKNPKGVLFMSGCTAAFVAALVVLPNFSDLTEQPKEEFSKVASSVETGTTESTDDEIVVTGTRIEREDSDATVDSKNVTDDKAMSEDIAARVEERQALISTERDVGSGWVAPEKPQSVPPAPKMERVAPSLPQLQSMPSSSIQSDSSFSSNLRGEAQYGMRSERMRPNLDQIDPYYQPEPSNDKFEQIERNPVLTVKEKPVSTFSVDVDTASYTFMRASINQGRIPRPDTIRVEEMVNYFPYDYTAPKSAKEPFKANVTVAQTPWNADTKLMHIGIKGYVPPAAEKPRSNIVLLIDTSGSMNQANKLPLLINSFKLLLNTLDEDDTVSIVTYAGSAGTVLEPTPATERSKIDAALNRLRAGGSTAGAAGLELAYMKAQESFDEDGVNRVILATDGDFNVGFSSPDEMKRFIEKKRETGIFLSVLGFGMGNYNDALMQSLAQNGNGVAAYIDSLSEANKVLADEAGSALIPIAKDVKIQVEFNPATIAEYRLIGYETRALKREDFNNDKVDAGDINSGHTVTAIYEMTPVGSPAVKVDDLRYVSTDDEPIDTGSDEFAFVKIRHKLPNADKSTLQTFPIGPDQERNMRRASEDMRFATAVAAVGQKLRGDTQLSDFSYADAIKMATSAKGEDKHGYRAEFIQLVRLIDSMDQ